MPRRFAARLLPPLLLALSCLPPPAVAETAATMRIARSVEDFLAEAAKPYGEEVKIELGRIADNPRFDACSRWQASLPPGQKAWGRVSVALRCSEGAQASLFVGAHVRVFGNYVVMARPVQGGQELVADDLRLERGEVSAQATDVILRSEDVVGRSTRQALSASQPLRALHLRNAPAISAGQVVRLVAQGKGFAVSYEGQALNTAGAGQLVRVKVEGGKIVSGRARADGTVELNAD